MYLRHSPLVATAYVINGGTAYDSKGQPVRFYYAVKGSPTLTDIVGHLKDGRMPRYAELIYNGFWFAPEREMLQAAIDTSQEHVEGTVRLKLYKGNIITCGRKSPKSLYDPHVASMEGVKSWYNQSDATGFIRLNGLRLRARKLAQGGPKV